MQSISYLVILLYYYFYLVANNFANYIDFFFFFISVFLLICVGQWQIMPIKLILVQGHNTIKRKPKHYSKIRNT